MRALCAELETGTKRGEKNRYEALLQDIQKWYLTQHKQYETLLKGDMLSKLGTQFGEQLEHWDELAMTGYTENSAAKSDLFDRTEQLCKLMLSVYSYGPDNTCPATFKNSRDSWLNSKLTFPHIIELLQAQLQTHGEGGDINLATFTEEKKVRNKLTHQGEVSVCASAIRCYNILRSMLIFLSPESRSTLPRFTYPSKATCDTQQLIRRLKDFKFDMEHTMLVVGPLHDLPSEVRLVLANLPWSAVIDLDGCSSFGGLHSEVQFPNINEQRLQLETARNFNPKRGFTTWFTCGNFANYAYCQPSSEPEQNRHLEKNGILFSSKTSFCNNYWGLESDMEDCIKALIHQFAEKLRPLNILYIHTINDESRLVSSIIDSCENEFHRNQSVPYTITAMYYDSPEDWADELKRLKRKYEPDAFFPLDNLYCDLDSMASGLIESQRELPVLTEKVEPFRLPSESGTPTGIGQNLAINLSDVFEVLYEDIGEVSSEQATQEREAFFRGGTAAWSVFHDEQTASLLNSETYMARLSNIKDVLAHIPDPDSGASRIFTILHSPGIGGSTLLRQIGWDLHLKYPVLLVKRYDKRIRELVRNLYDKQKQGILLLADDTISDRERLKEDIRTLDRACALVLSARENEKSNGNVEKRGCISFSFISREGETVLRTRFKEHSTLSPAQLNEKDLDYDKFVKPTGMRCPFMIGLYYQQEHFNGVTGYVERMMEQVKEKREVKILAMLALCHYYGNIGLPQNFVNRYLQIPLGSSYLRNYPHADAVLLPIQNGLGGDIDTYNPKHYLISRELLEQCCQRLYGSTIRNSLTDLSKLLIDAVFDAYQTKPADIYQDILEFLFINKEDAENKFSLLILAVASPSGRKEILLYLAEKFDALTEHALPEDADYLYRMTAHFYGHLGRLCHNRDIGLDNPSDARIYCERAVELMEASSQGYPDSRIYHMLGESRSALFRKQLDAENLRFQGAPDSFSPQQGYEAYEKEIDEICIIFEKAASYGSEEYAISSLIDLYLQYLIKVYHWKHIQNPAQLSEQQMGYKTEIERLLDWSYTREMSERSRGIFQNLEDNYHKVLNPDSGGDIQYYENRLSKLKGRTGVDSEILNARRGLIWARLSKHYAQVKENPGKYITLKDSELLSVLGQLEEILGGQCDPSDYRQRSTRISCFDKWFYLAKMPGSARSLEKAISYSDRWIELCDYGGNDPRPFYYYAVCSTLYVLAGNSVDTARIAFCWKKCENLGRNYVDRLRDVIVRGSGMEQLLDMRYAGRIPTEYVEGAGRTPLILGGIFNRIEADRGYIRLSTPSEWNGKEVKFTRGRGNTLGENQRTHNLETFAGFSYEGFRAIDQYVRDISASEVSPQLKKHDPAEQIKQSEPSPRKEVKSWTGRKAVGKQFSKFIPDPRGLHITQGDGGRCSGWINGKIEGIPAGISIEKDIYRFDNDSIERCGGLREIAQVLSRKEHLPCIIIKSQEDGHYIASLFQTGKTLSELLNTISEPQEKALVQNQETEPEKKATLNSGTSVSVLLSSVESGMAFGSFDHNGATCQIKIPLKGKKMVDAMKKAYSQKKAVNILITGYTNGLYSGRKR